VAGAGNGSTYKGKIRLYTSGDYDGGTVSLELDERGNLKLGGGVPSSAAENVFCQATGVDPDYSFPDSFQLYSSDITAGNAAPHFRTENGTIIKLDQAIDTTASPTFADINATGAYSVGGLQVVGARAGAVDDAVAGTIVAQFNTLLARLRAHGLIGDSQSAAASVTATSGATGAGTVT
jgi:hypothetical protein